MESFLFISTLGKANIISKLTIKRTGKPHESVQMILQKGLKHEHE